MSGSVTPDDGLGRRMALVAAVVFAVGLLALGARATYGARVTADEPQYLLTSLSLGEDFDLDISDEIAEERFRPFHEIGLNPQTVNLTEEGQRISPHDPLLPLLLAVPMRIGGWVGAKVALSALAGITAAAALHLAVRRFGAGLGAATWVVGGFFASPPLAAYATQVYPAVPAALCAVLAVTAATGPFDRRWSQVGVAAVIALPWLSVKFVPIAAVAAAALLWRARTDGRRRVALASAVLAAAGLVYVVVHQRIYGGWTAYAAGDHFIDGELLVVGDDSDYLGRSRRLVGLLVDRGFGLIAWNPAYLALPLGLAGLVRAKQPGRGVLLAVVGAGWATATWPALTMHGWWWPGRQVVPVLPLAAVAVAVGAGRAGRRLSAVLAGTGLGLATWLWLVAEASTGRRTLVVDFEETANPWYGLWRRVLPDHRVYDTGDKVLTGLWIGAFAVGIGLLWRRAAAKTGSADKGETAAIGGPPT